MLVKHKEYQYQKHKYLNLVTEQSPKDRNIPNNGGSVQIEQWCKNKIQDKDITEKNRKTYYWCLHYPSEKYSFANRLYLSSHKPEEYEE